MNRTRIPFRVSALIFTLLASSSALADPASADAKAISCPGNLLAVLMGKTIETAASVPLIDPAKIDRAKFLEFNAGLGFDYSTQAQRELLKIAYAHGWELPGGKNKNEEYVERFLESLNLAERFAVYEWLRMVRNHPNNPDLLIPMKEVLRDFRVVNKSLYVGANEGDMPGLFAVLCGTVGAGVTTLATVFFYDEIQPILIAGSTGALVLGTLCYRFAGTQSFKTVHFSNATRAMQLGNLMKSNYPDLKSADTEALSALFAVMMRTSSLEGLSIGDGGYTMNKVEPLLQDFDFLLTTLGKTQENFELLLNKMSQTLASRFKPKISNVAAKRQYFTLLMTALAEEYLKKQSLVEQSRLKAPNPDFFNIVK